MNLRLLSTWGCLVLAVSPALAAEPQSTPENVLNGLHPEHPRLLARADDFKRLSALCVKNPEAQQWVAHLQGGADRLLNQPPLEYRIPDGKRLLSVSRGVKDRVLLLALMYRLTGDQRYANRAWVELDQVTRFKDWNPSHFLDTAEMTFAVSIGYDWLFDVWDTSQRAQLRNAIIVLGLNEGHSIYRKNAWWSRSIHNWNQVCNGGMAVGALAIADEQPQLAGEVLAAALRSVPLAMHEFRPDGGWGEGPGYWRYATEYNVYLLAALQTALDNEFGLADLPGFSVTGDFPIHFKGPTGLTFNYADAHDGWSGAAQLFWFASRFDQHAYAAAQMPYAARRPSPLDLLWGARWLSDTAQAATQPLDRHFAGVSVVTMRSAWDDANALFVGFKGGDNRVNHGHLDLGSFVLDAGGRRWAVDLGPDDYNIPGYFGKQRWSYYRTMTAGHNTLCIEDQNQSTTATASIIRFFSSDESACAVADLTAAYPQTQRVWRGMALIDRRQGLLEDEVEAAKPVHIAWYMHTTAEVSIDGPRVTLSQGDRQLVAWILAPADARFQVTQAVAQPPQLPLEGVRRLSV